MFVRKIHNRSGTTSIQIISKANGNYKILKTIGTSSESREIQKLEIKAENHINEIKGMKTLFNSEKDLFVESFLENISNRQIRVVGPEMILGKLFNSIGFNLIKDQLFKHLVLARIIDPGSKLRTIDYLRRYENLNYSVDEIYRFLDKLSRKYQDRIEKIAFEYTKKRLKGKINVVFYDMTTLYFEAENEDDLRKIGFSKDGKFQNPQIMLGLLIGKGGYPIGWDVFEGNIFEGHTLIPTLEKFQKKFDLDKPIIVADSGLLSEKNIKNLEENKYKYILGARIKNLDEDKKEKILSLDLSDGDAKGIRYDKKRLIVAYSIKRAKKDKRNREKGLARLEKKVKTGKLTKASINNRGYNKYLKMESKIKVRIDYDKFEEDAKWDGLKGYITNSSLSKKNLLSHYRELWQIEKAFRISKSDLRIRPIYHRLKDRILAHISISFTAYTVYKELERILMKNKSPYSAKHACDIIQNIYEISCTLPDSLRESKIILKMDEEQTFLNQIITKELG